jgi:hypothetical protein
MGKRSTRKGKDAERTIARAFRDAGIDAHRNIQTRGPDDSDVPALCFWNEVKDRKLVSCRTTWLNASDESPDDKIPVAITHQPREPWLVTVSLEDWLAILAGMQLNAEALEKARRHVDRQRLHGKHEQDRQDAKEWMAAYGES